MGMRFVLAFCDCLGMGRVTNDDSECQMMSRRMDWNGMHQDL